ncbi:hypothetical protein OUZ56_002915 [Daphnia magna]|uniref:Uncharacterized protein n=1 Tax=Daphnia magna TaxID=35525 RepID=A0ABR0A7M9_9CRUS|nr:hypothetical protein OUZ56_002915 [Daphnia magna]
MFTIVIDKDFDKLMGDLRPIWKSTKGYHLFNGNQLQFSSLVPKIYLRFKQQQLIHAASILLKSRHASHMLHMH